MKIQNTTKYNNFMSLKTKYNNLKKFKIGYFLRNDQYSQVNIYKTNNSLNVKSLGYILSMWAITHQQFFNLHGFTLNAVILQPHPKFRLLKFAKLLNPATEWKLQKQMKNK